MLTLNKQMLAGTICWDRGWKNTVEKVIKWINIFEQIKEKRFWLLYNFALTK